MGSSEYITLEQFSRAIGKSPAIVQRYHDHHLIDSFEDRGQVFVKKSELLDWDIDAASADDEIPTLHTVYQSDRNGISLRDELGGEGDLGPLTSTWLAVCAAVFLAGFLNPVMLFIPLRGNEHLLLGEFLGYSEYEPGQYVMLAAAVGLTILIGYLESGNRSATAQVVSEKAGYILLIAAAYFLYSSYQILYGLLEQCSGIAPFFGRLGEAVLSMLGEFGAACEVFDASTPVIPIPGLAILLYLGVGLMVVFVGSKSAEKISNDFTSFN